MKSFNLLLQAQAQGQNPMMTIGMLVLIVVVFYFFMIRPQMKKTKQMKAFREALKKGDKIVTIGGIHGKIVEVQETTFLIEVEGLNKLKIEKSAVAMDNSTQLSAETK